jgi:hypothetical protein
MKRPSIGFGRWLVILFAPNALMAVVSSVSVILLLLYLLLLWGMSWSAASYSVETPSEVRDGFAIASVLLGSAVGVIRVGRFHPAFDKKYADWLATSNWRPGLPLPKGPLHPTRNDAIGLVLLGIVAGAFCWVLRLSPLDALVALAGVFLGVALTCVAACARTGRFHNWRLLLSIGLLPGLLDPSLVYASAPIAALLAYLFELRDLRDFPWPPFTPKATRVVGWPFRQLLEEPRNDSVTWPIAALEGLIAGALCWVLPELNGARKNGFDVVVLVLMLSTFWVVPAALRYASSRSIFCPRFCLGERLGRWRPIVWRHDRWLLAAIALPAIPIAILLLPIEVHYKAPLAAGLGLFAARVRLWDLRADFYTGPQSLPPWIVPPRFNANSQMARQQLRCHK